MPTLPLDDVTLYYADDNFTDPWTEPPVMLLQHRVLCTFVRK